MRAESEEKVALERGEPEEELHPSDEASASRSATSGTLKWLRGVRGSAVLPAFAIISITLLLLVVLRSLCLHANSKQKVSPGLVERRLATGDEDEEPGGNPISLSPEICRQVQESLSQLEGSGTEASSPSPEQRLAPTGKGHPTDEEMGETSTGSAAEGHEESEAGAPGTAHELFELTDSEWLDGMLTAEDEEELSPEWLFELDEHVSLNEGSSRIGGASESLAGGSAGGGFKFGGMPSTRHWKPMSSDSEESDSSGSHSQPSSPGSSESDSHESAEDADRRGSGSNNSEESLQTEGGYASESDRQGSSSSTTSPPQGEPLDLTTSRGKHDDGAGSDPAVRNILLKPTVNQSDLERLILLTAHLVRLGTTAMPYLPSGHAKAAMVRALACRFLVLEAIWAIGDVVGPALNKEYWWHTFSEKVAGSSLDLHLRPKKRNPARINEKLVALLYEALLKYRLGVRPSAEEAREIKEALFCGPSAPVAFKGPAWDTLRRDFEGSSGQRC
ncbi:hypothetical protein ACSSS7_005688 [Eimeria intestinalis]